MKRLALAVALSLSLTGCVSLASGIANIAASVTSSTPSQVTTLSEAIQTATLATRAADVAVNTGKLSHATIIEINSLSDAIHAALGDLETANSQGKSLTFSSFNAALSAWNAYTTANAVPH